MQEYKVLILENGDSEVNRKVWTNSHVLIKRTDGSIEKIKDRWEYPTNSNKVTLYFPNTKSPKYSKEFFKDLSNKGIKSISLSEEDFYDLMMDMNANSCDGGSWLPRETFDIQSFSVYGVKVGIQ